MNSGLKRRSILGFAAAAVVAGTRQPGYSHRKNHVSGLAARGEASAALMVPGFLALAAAERAQDLADQAAKRAEAIWPRAS